jgi:hypothetical protein
MKTYFLTIFLGILLLAACTPTPTSTPVAVSPMAIPSATMTSTPLPQGNLIIVTSTSDSGPGSLRQALQDAQDYGTVTFDPTVFPPEAPATIFVSGELPHIHVNNLTLDASNAGVILDGSQIPGDWVAGLQIVMSDANTIRGLQISHFPGPGIAISGDSTHNVIGGDRSLGDGPFGQGNLLIHNAIGIDLSTNGTTLITITGNLIGTDAADDSGLGNLGSGITISEGSHGNTIGPDNLIAYNRRAGVEVYHTDTYHNTITQNSIHDNNRMGIDLMGGGNAKLASPIIIDYDLSAGTATGATCANCTVEIFSDSSNGGEIYEDRTTADAKGIFTLNKGDPFSGPNLTATTTDVDGNTSQFSDPFDQSFEMDQPEPPPILSAPSVERFPNNPIIVPEMLPGDDGADINGPSLIRVPSWVEDPLGQYYLYFAHHVGTYIRMAYADDLAGPWNIYNPGTLRLEDTICKDIFGSIYANYKHLASPDIHVDSKSQQIRMYFHCPVYLSGPVDENDSYKQVTLLATSSDGLNFEAASEPLGNAYFRVFQWANHTYALGMPGVFYRSTDGLSGFKEGPTLFSEDMRHSAVIIRDGKLLIFYTMVGDNPERILLTEIELHPDWMTWSTTDPVVVLEPEFDWEGANLPLEPSVRGFATGLVRQLRDPAIFVEEGHTYLLYSVAGESGIAIAELHWH